MISQALLNQTARRCINKTAQLSPTGKQTLWGAGLGAGLGGLSWLLRPKDRDQNQLKEALIAILSGAAMGGAAGYGFSKLPNRPDWLKGSPKKDEKPEETKKEETKAKTEPNTLQKPQDIVPVVQLPEDQQAKNRVKNPFEAPLSNEEALGRIGIKIVNGKPVYKGLSDTAVDTEVKNRQIFVDSAKKDLAKAEAILQRMEANKKPEVRVPDTSNAKPLVVREVGGKNIYSTPRNRWDWDKRPSDPHAVYEWDTLKKLDPGRMSTYVSVLEKQLPKGSTPVALERISGTQSRVWYRDANGKMTSFTTAPLERTFGDWVASGFRF